MPPPRKPAIKDPILEFMEFADQQAATKTPEIPDLEPLTEPKAFKAESVLVMGKGEERPIPEAWSNGSAVMAEGAMSHGWPLCVRYEDAEGFRGRIEKIGKLYHVWAWHPETRTYSYQGATDDVPTSFKLLPHDDGKPHKALSKTTKSPTHRNPT